MQKNRSYVAVLFLLVFAVVSCENDENEETLLREKKPVILLQGKAIDTAFLYTNYHDPGASVFEDKDGKISCNDYVLVSDVENTLNNRLPGTYYIHYNAKDSTGKKLAAVTRTVHMVENSTTFLNGNYDVVCTCSAIAASSSPTVSTESYTAVAVPQGEKDCFELFTLKIGYEKVVSSVHLADATLDVGFFSTDYARVSTSGTLSPSKNSFTIESTSYPFSPAITYSCTNVYTKHLLIK